MAIKLLKKDEIAKLQAKDRSNEIAEGLKVSRRVDSLRELQSKEEEALNKFRSESLAAIAAEIRKLDGEKEALQAAVGDLRSEKEKGLKDVESKQRELERREMYLEAQKGEIEKRLLSLGSQEKVIRENLRNSAGELERARTRTDEATRLQTQAQADLDNAKAKVASAVTVEDRVLALKEEVEKGLAVQEEGIRNREKALLLREKENEKRTQELTTEKLQINDQRATLERAFARLKK